MTRLGTWVLGDNRFAKAALPHKKFTKLVMGLSSACALPSQDRTPQSLRRPHVTLLDTRRVHLTWAYRSASVSTQDLGHKHDSWVNWGQQQNRPTWRFQR